MSNHSEFSTGGVHQNWRISSDGVSVKRMPKLPTYLISGNRETVRQHCALEEIYAWPGHVKSDPYCLSIRPDQLAWIGACPLKDGWSTEGYAVSTVTDAYRVFEVTGERSIAFLSRGTSLRFDGFSGSVAVHFAGFSVWMYHHAVTRGIRLHVENAYSGAFALWCERTLSVMSSKS